MKINNMDIIDFKTGERTKYISEGELNKIINTRLSLWNTTGHKINLRDAFMFSFLFFTGMRLNEFRITQIKCINWEEMELIVPMLKRPYWKKEALKEYGIPQDRYLTPEERENYGLTKYVKIPINYVPKTHLKIWKLYISNYGLYGEDYIVSLSTSGIQKRIKKISKEVIGNIYTPHDLRHSCGVHLYRNIGLDLMDVQAVLRHADLRMTERYARITLKDLKERIDVKLMIGGV